LCFDVHDRPSPGGRFFVVTQKEKTMTQQELERELCNATGEALSEIRHLGFGLADPSDVDFDPEPYDHSPQVVDWDEVQQRQNVAIFESRRPRHRAA